MASFPIELKDILVVLSDLKLNLRSEASSFVGALLVEGKAKTSREVDVFNPKLYLGTAGPSFGCCTSLARNDGKMDGVGGSENTPLDAETGKLKPVLLSEENVHFQFGLPTEIEGKTDLVPPTE